MDLKPDSVETYSGPSSPVDVVLMVHVCYYFRETFSTQIKRALQWLRPGGHLILIHKELSQFRKEIGKIFKHPSTYNIQKKKKKKKIQKRKKKKTKTKKQLSMAVVQYQSHCL